MKKNIFIFCLIFTNNILSADIYLGGNCSYAIFDMGNLKDMNSLLIQEIDPIPAKIINNFPSFFTFKIESFYQSETKNIYGIFFSIESTGSRIGVKDYSGEYKLDQNLLGQSLGISLYFPASKKSENISIYLGSDIGYVTTSYDFKEYFRVFNDKIITSNKRTYNNFYIEPGVKISYSQFKFIIMAEAKYQMGLSGDNVNETNFLSSEWNGPRLGISCYYKLK